MAQRRSVRNDDANNHNNHNINFERAVMCHICVRKKYYYILHAAERSRSRALPIAREGISVLRVYI